jgi:hypothetical protein
LRRGFNTFKPKLFQVIFKNSVHTAHFTITKIKWLMLFKEIISVYSDNHIEPMNINTEVLIVKVTGTYSYHSALKSYVTGG